MDSRWRPIVTAARRGQPARGAGFQRFQPAAGYSLPHGLTVDEQHGVDDWADQGQADPDWMFHASTASRPAFIQLFDHPQGHPYTRAERSSYSCPRRCG